MPILTDARRALRLLARSPLFALTATVSLALGVAASSTVFSLADALLLAPAAGVRGAEDVVDVGRSDGGSGFDNMSHPAFCYLRDHTRTLAGLAALDFSGSPMSLSDGRSSERVFARMVSATYFDLLGARPALGRLFLRDEDRVAGEPAVVVLTHAFWLRRFGGDPTVVGRTLRLNNHDFTVVGVAEQGFEGTSLVGTELWAPISMVGVVRGRGNADMLTDPRAVWHVAIGRLRPGIERGQAEAELNTLMAAFKAAEPRAKAHHGVSVLPLSRVPGPVRAPFLAFIGLLFALTGSLLAIACSNVAGMMLARATARRREMATRVALGASRGRIVAQLLTETAVLFSAAGLLALPLTFALVRALEGLLPALPVLVRLDLGVNLRVMLFALAVSLAAALVFGLAPARQALARDPAATLHGARATADRRRLGARNLLVGAQVALSLMLVVTSFQLVRTLRNAALVDPGFEVADVDLATVDVSLSGYRGAAAVDLIERFEERVATIGGVTAVAAARMIPLQGGGFGLGGVRIPGRDTRPGEATIAADWNVVSPAYFDTVRMPLVAGRGFAADDREGERPVAIVNQTFARLAWPDGPAVGEHFMQQTGPGEERAVEVVGVVADARYRTITEAPRPFVFVPLAQQPIGEATLFVRHAPGREVFAELRAAIAQVEPTVPVLLLQSLREATAIGLLPQRIAASIAGGVGSVGLLLAALGLYGLMAYVVAQRTREIAIRMALGASRTLIQRAVLGQAARLGLAGGLAGVALAAVMGVLMRSLLVGVGALDPLSVAATALVFAAVLASAAWSPAHRAAGTEPAVALRAE